MKSCAFQLYCADFQVKELLFGLSLIGLSAVALYNFRARELLSTGIFCLLILQLLLDHQSFFGFVEFFGDIPFHLNIDDLLSFILHDQ